jgi:hypothetical protein
MTNFFKYKPTTPSAYTNTERAVEPNYNWHEGFWVQCTLPLAIFWFPLCLLSPALFFFTK